ncbi:MAG: hypothetical protein CBARDMAM_3761 [uncultured Caballeronia sp.]|nr:MAG: hypothetical protein CBARDMAM_3761 [uncultured Caballeronia sp.]
MVLSRRVTTKMSRALHLFRRSCTAESQPARNPDRFASGGIAANFHGSPYNLRKSNYRFPNPC